MTRTQFQKGDGNRSFVRSLPKPMLASGWVPTSLGGSDPNRLLCDAYPGLSNVYGTLKSTPIVFWNID